GRSTETGNAQLVHVARPQADPLFPIGYAASDRDARPLPAYHEEQLDERVLAMRRRVRPGMTGLWQVSGRSDVGTDGMEHFDSYYVRNWSIWLDIVVLARTFQAVSRSAGAY
ncbi:MAG: sugar transferase, partial [Bacteroidetes bacterium]|nr:sugar transferase [Bacteroidota bacterium]